VHLGVDSFVSAVTDPRTGEVASAAQRIAHLLEEIALADRVGLHSFGIGEHHRREYFDSAPVVLLAAAAARTSRIRLRSAVTVLSAADPVRVFQEFATLDLVSGGRAELVVGRGSFVEAFPLFGLDLDDYDDLFEQKLDLLLAVRASAHPHWSGRHRPALHGQGVFPRPEQDEFPISVGVGGTRSSFVRAGALGLPLMVAIIGGDPRAFAPMIQLYRDAGRQAGHPTTGCAWAFTASGSWPRPPTRLRTSSTPAGSRCSPRCRRSGARRFPHACATTRRAALPAPYFIGDPATVAEKARAVSAAPRRRRVDLAADDEPAGWRTPTCCAASSCSAPRSRPLVSPLVSPLVAGQGLRAPAR
jgi:alkanesulfonate monooxygenase SsuD/methylene tetrahydromethanopterin reductase-like flavin-dependent oxidoreductase (luciferase family)